MLSVLIGILYLFLALVGIFMVLCMIDFGIEVYYIIRRRFR